VGIIVAVLVIAIVVPVASRGGGLEPGLTDQNNSEDASAGGGAADGLSEEDGDGAKSAALLTEGVVTENAAKAAGANELGLIPVLMYTRFADDCVPPVRFRADIDRLIAADFYPTTVKDMVQGTMDIPAGKSPIILTFDDSSPTQYKIVPVASLDPDCAIAVLQEAVNEGHWPSKATFFPLLNVNPDNILFGQPQYAEQKIRDLADWGYEVGSHTTNHKELSLQTSEQVQSELARSQAELERIIGDGYEVFSLAPPYGELPKDLSLMTSGEFGGMTYTYGAVVMSSGGYSLSPFSNGFNQYRIPRIDAMARKTVPNLISHFENNPGLRYVSDGDPNTVSFPRQTASELGVLRSDLDLRVVVYD
jgi:hypothetical protein